MASAIWAKVQSQTQPQPALAPAPSSATAPRLNFNAPVGRSAAGSHASSSAMTQTEITSRLSTLRNLENTGVISKTEHLQLRAQLLRQLVTR